MLYICTYIYATYSVYIIIITMFFSFHCYSTYSINNHTTNLSLLYTSRLFYSQYIFCLLYSGVHGNDYVVQSVSVNARERELQRV